MAVKPDSSACVLLFSGGRDSTIAAVRLNRAGHPLSLVTVTSDHLVGIEAVRARLVELKPHLPPETIWLHVLQPSGLPGDPDLRSPTCLPCHQSYAATGVIVANQLNSPRLAFGYARYQSDWPEQTPEATARLMAILARRGIDLVLPAYELATKQQAIDELRSYGLSADALEQKCTKQQTNVALDPTALKTELAGWERALLNTLDALEGRCLTVVREMRLAELIKQ